MLRQSRTSLLLFVFAVFVFFAANYIQAESRQAKIGAEFVDNYFKKTCPEYAKKPESILKNLRDGYEMMLRDGADVNKLVEIGEKQFSCGEYAPSTKEQLFLKTLRADLVIFGSHVHGRNHPRQG